MPKTQFPKQNHGVSPKRVLGTLVAVTVAFLLLASVVGLVEKYIVIRQRVKGLKTEQKALLEKQATIRETNSYIETTEGQEYELRSKYNVVKEGEGMIVITEPELPESTKGESSRVGRWWESLMRGLGISKE